MEQKETRIVYLDMLRIFSSFAVMLLHVAASQWNAVPVESFEWQIFNMYNAVPRFCVPVFIMISGVFFLNSERAFSMKKLFHKNIFRIVQAFMFWSFCYSLFRNLRRFRSITPEMIRCFIEDFIVGHYHLWFLFTLVGLYLSIPFLRKICESKKLMQYYLLLSFTFVCVINLFLLVPEINNILTKVLSKASISFFLGYTGYFILGYYLYCNPMNRFMRRCIYILGLLSIAATIIITALISVYKGSPTGSLFDFLLPNTCFSAMAVFVFFGENMSKIQLSPAALHKIFILSELSFGMYLVHEFFNVLLFKVLNITPLSFHALFSIPFFTIIVYLLSFCAVFVFRKIPYLGKNMI